MSNLKFVYIRNEWKKRDITIVSNLVREGDKNIVTCGWAFRSNHDQFIKREGKKLAIERMNSNDPNYSFSFEIKEPKFFDITTIILNKIVTSESTPKKYLRDLEYDLEYFTECAVNGAPHKIW